MIVCIVGDVAKRVDDLTLLLAKHTLIAFHDPYEGLEYCLRHSVDVLVVEQRMSRLSGVRLVRSLKEAGLELAALVITAPEDREEVVEAVESNLIHMHILKPCSHRMLALHVSRTVDLLSLSRTNMQLTEQLMFGRGDNEVDSGFPGGSPQPIDDVFIGSAPSMERVRTLSRLYAASTEPILISGETGTGKELLARAVHRLSFRRNRIFLPVNCSAIQESILESELFGYLKGAFTGAVRDKMGIFSAADGGTVFLDEIGDLPLQLQPKLLRVLQFGTFMPVGGVAEAYTDIRVISATNRNLKQQVARGLFRADLLYRINTLHLQLPPLRQREEDIPGIIDRICHAADISLPPFRPDALRYLTSHDFPGNIRELRNVVERLAILSRSAKRSSVDTDLVREALGSPWRSAPEVSAYETPTVPSLEKGDRIDLAGTLDRIRRGIVEVVFRQEGGNITRTASRLGLSRQGLKNSLRAYGLLLPRLSSPDPPPE